MASHHEWVTRVRWVRGCQSNEHEQLGRHGWGVESRRGCWVRGFQLSGEVRSYHLCLWVRGVGVAGAPALRSHAASRWACAHPSNWVCYYHPNVSQPLKYNE